MRMCESSSAKAIVETATEVNHPRLKAEAFDGRRKSQVYQTEV
jgi:hypothetical protein